MTGFVRNQQVDNVAQALEVIRDLLVGQGWLVDSGSLDSLSFVFKSPTVVNGYRPWLRYDSPSPGVLALQGDFDGSGIFLSDRRDSEVVVGSRIWLAADHEAICQYIKPPTGAGDAYHAGALDRLSPTDGTAVQVGRLSTSFDASHAQEAQEFNGTQMWQYCDQGIFTNIYTDGSLLMPVTNTPMLASYFRMRDGVYRGDVKFAVTGLAGATPGTEFEVINPDTLEVEKVYVSTGEGGFLVFDAT